VSEDAGIEPRTVATLALTARRSKHSARSHPYFNLIIFFFSRRFCEAGDAHEAFQIVLKSKVKKKTYL
jgi:hypothetical protein